MTSPSSAPGGESRLALTAGVGCYLIWGFVPLLFQALGRLHAGPWEILAHRTLWAVPTAALIVLAAGQSRQVAAAFRQPKVLALLALSAGLIALNWGVFINAVNSGRVLETSLGYFINPLLNMAAGALLFRERLDRLALAAIGLAAVGIGLQTLALGQVPAVSLALAISFCLYGIVRKRVDADAQTGLLIECLIIGVAGLGYVVWLERSGGGHFFVDPKTTLLLLITGPASAIPLVLFAWSARRIPFSAIGFLQFIAPTITFVTGLVQGEAFTPLRGLSFVFIWAGVALFAYGVWRRTRQLAQAPATA